jgi:hypothetical protein
MKTAAFLILITAVVTYAQMPASRKSKSDAEKIASALQAGPEFVTRNATVLDYPTSPSGEFRVLRAGTNGWTCLPGLPEGAHDEPGCFDQVFLQFIKDSIASHTPNVRSVGISYMYGGKWVRNKSHAMGSGNEFHVGPHIMIIGLDQLRTLTDAARFSLVLWSQLFNWRAALIIVKPETLIGWHRKGVQAVLGVEVAVGKTADSGKSSPADCAHGAGEPDLGARIAAELSVKLGILVSPRPSIHRHELPADCRIRAQDVLGGLHHEYWLEEIAA